METTEINLDQYWQTIYAIAEELSNSETDPNELGKAIAYLRAYGEREKAGTLFFKYLETLVRNGKTVGHSGKTFEYYKSLETACKQHLQPYQNDVVVMQHILGWTIRLLRYYKSGGSTDFFQKSQESQQSQRQAEVAQVVQSHSFAVDDVLPATITAIKGNQVTYQILDAIKLTSKEPKKASSLSEGQEVQVIITALKEDGSIKNVKYCTGSH